MTFNDNAERTRNRGSLTFGLAASSLVALSAVAAVAPATFDDEGDDKKQDEVRAWAQGGQTSSISGHDGEHEYRIESRVEDGEEEVRLWIDDEEIEVDSMEEAHEVLRERGIGANFDVQFFHGEDGEWLQPRFFEGFEPGQFQWHQPLTTNFEPPRSMLGVQLEPLSADLGAFLEIEDGVLVRGVVEDSPAEDAGLKAMDVIVAAQIGDEEFEEPNDGVLREAIAKSEPGTKVELIVVRKDGEHEIDAELVEWDEEKMGAPAMRLFHGGPDAEGRWEIQPFQGVDPRWFQGENQFRGWNWQPFDETMRLRVPEGFEGHEDMMKRMEEQMHEIEKMLDQLRDRQDDLRERVEKNSRPDA